MKSLQDYRNIYKEIALNCGYKGESVDIIVLLLAQATYINEIENVAIAQESMLEKATLPNSKIQHCMNNMYSVFRGTCPRVITKFSSTKYMSISKYDVLVTSNNFKIYYLGYYDSSKDSGGSSIEEGFVEGPITIYPELEVILIGLMSSETVSDTWTVDANSTYYLEINKNQINNIEEDLSNDMWCKVNGDYATVTRLFLDHVVNALIFDLTTTSFSSRLYVADYFRNTLLKDVDEIPAPENTVVEACWYKYCTKEDFNQNELKKISIKGGTMIPFDSTWIGKRGGTEIATGVCIIDGSEPDKSDYTHYRSNRERYINSVIRSNSDIGRLLEEMFPAKVRQQGTVYDFSLVDTTFIEKTKNLHDISIDSIIPTYDDQDLIGFEIGSDGVIGYWNKDEAEGDINREITLCKSTEDSDHYYETSFGNSTYTSYLALPLGTFKDGKPLNGVISIPTVHSESTKGTLQVVYGSDYFDPSYNTAMYKILPTASRINKGTNTIDVMVLKMLGGVTSLLSTVEEIDQENLRILYLVDSQLIENKVEINNYLWKTPSDDIDRGTITIDIRKLMGLDLTLEEVPLEKLEELGFPAVLFEEHEDEDDYDNDGCDCCSLCIVNSPENEESHLLTSKLTIFLEKVFPEGLPGKEEEKSPEMDREIIPIVSAEDTTISYAFDLVRDTIIINTDEAGNILDELPIKATNAAFFEEGKQVKPTWETVEITGIDYSIDDDGNIWINYIAPEIKSISIPIIGLYNGSILALPLKLRKTNSVYENIGRKFYLGEPGVEGVNILQTFFATVLPLSFSFEYTGGSKELYIWAADDYSLSLYSKVKGHSVRIYDLAWETVDLEVKNLINIDSGEVIVPALDIYYIPYSENNTLTKQEVNNFKEKRSSYFMTPDVNVHIGTEYIATFVIDLELFLSISVEDKISSILESYQYKFDLNLSQELDSIKALICKISNIKQILDITLSFKNQNGDTVLWEDIEPSIEHSYFKIQYTINTTIYSA